ncbi:Protein of unknown function [Bacillus sp. OK838]|nr:Protein of unknown function [Bacillus sp. OK838]
MRKKIYFFVIIVILVLGGIFIYNSLKGDKTVLKETEKAVYNYVVNTEGYKDEDIISIEPYYSRLEQPKNAYSAYVIFKDRPNEKVEYSYIRDKEKKEVFRVK